MPNHPQQKTASEATQETNQDFPLTAFVAFMTLFGSAQQVLKSRMQDEAEKGLGPLHLRALCLCQRNPASTQQWLVQAMGRDKGQIARLIRELEERGFLCRSPDERDKRVWRLAVTQEGEEKCRWFSVLEAKLANDLFAGLGATECQQLEHTFKQLRARMNIEAETELK
jgi:DNA-binding MarR family transcriptional regulator